MFYYHLTDIDAHGMGSFAESIRLGFENSRNLEYDFWLNTFTLDEILDWVGTTPSILRMDIKYSERDVLENFSWAHHPYLWQIDHHQKNIHWFEKMFKEQGYEVLGTNLGGDGMEIWAQLR